MSDSRLHITIEISCGCLPHEVKDVYDRQLHRFVMRTPNNGANNLLPVAPSALREMKRTDRGQNLELAQADLLVNNVSREQLNNEVKNKTVSTECSLLTLFTNK